jgi:hypothetical protein
VTCVFGVAELDFPGHTASSADISPLPRHVLLQFPAATCITAKKAIIASILLAHLQPNAILSLVVDASNTHVGAVLHQLYLLGESVQSQIPRLHL